MDVFKTPSGKLDLSLATKEDRISAWFLGKITDEDLHKNDRQIIDRWLSIWHSLNDFRSPRQAVDEHIKKHSVSERTAWSDLRDATKMWGNVASTSQQARWILLFEYAMTCLQLSIQSSDRTEMNRALKNLIFINKHLTTDGESLTPPVFVMNISIPGQGTKTYNMSDFGNAADTEFEQVLQQLHASEKSDVEIKQLLNEKPDQRDPSE